MGQARRAVAITLIGAATIAGALLAERLWSSHDIARAMERYATAHRLAGEVRLTEQQLNQAAMVAALSGDSHWVSRFDALVPKLQQSIEHASLLAPPSATKAFRDKTAETMAELDRMHKSAADALRSEAYTAAGALFNGERYTHQIGLLRQSAEELTTASLAATSAHVRSLQLRSYAIAGSIVLLAFIGSVVLWRRLTTGLARSRGSLMDAEARIQRLASSDLLTGLDNRAALHDAMQVRMSRARKLGEQLAVLYVDLDRFKPVNDSKGHMVGDMVLKEVSRRLARCLRQTDLRARFGGDEFVVVVDETNGTQTAQSAAERIIAAMSEPMRFGDITINIGASVGIARFPGDAQTDDELLRKADAALNRAKQSGRSGLCLYDPRQDGATSDRHELEQELREGIAAGQLEPYYQPIVSLARRNVLSLELLCRWRHPSRGLLTPDKFIKLAEDSGLIGPLTMALLNRACQDMARFPPQWRVSINVVPEQIQDPNLVSQFLAILKEHGVPPARLDVELTETALVNNTARAREVIVSLKRAGMTVTLDDFGTGYSSLAYLAEMNFDKIKIDRSFVNTLLTKPESAKIVDAIVGLSRSLGKDTVAEGVETEEQARALNRLGCNTGQGYLFGRPVPAKELEERAALVANQIAALA